MTDRLYYQNAYLTTFTGIVTEQKTQDGNLWLALDRSAFYPTSGGQPYDTGTLRFTEGEARVLDVAVEGDTVWHRVDREVPPHTQVEGEIDWPRRFDHMQQHGGEHILAGCIWNLFGGVTRGLHLGQEDSTIDVTMPDGRVHLNPQEMEELEEMANRRIQQDAPIKSWFPDEAELDSLPLRKPSAVKEQVRVVAAGDFEMVPCGGTHPGSTGQLGMLKIISITPAKSKMRVCFVAGMRALKYYQTLYNACQQAGSLLSAGADTLPQAVEKLQTNLTQTRYDAVQWQKKASQALAAQLSSQAERLDEYSLVLHQAEGADMEGLKTLAQQLIAKPHTIALLAASQQEGVVVTFARGEQVQLDMAKLLRDSGAKGGGKPDFAQGKAGSPAVLDTAAQAIRGLYST